jgi:hypothetical protein
MRHPRSSATANTTEKASKPVTKKRGKKVDAEESKPAKPEDDGEGEEKCKIECVVHLLLSNYPTN